MFRNNQYSLSTIFNQAGVYRNLGLPRDENEISNLDLLNSNTFENNVLMFMLSTCATTEAHYKPLMSDLNAILELINKELE